MILDTNFLIDLLKGEKNSIEKLEGLEKLKEPLLIPPGVIFELYVGVGGDNEEVSKIENEIERVNLTKKAEKEAAEVRKQLEDSGNPISSIDYLIAGTAKNMGEKILTRDSHFNRIDGLETQNY